MKDIQVNTFEKGMQKDLGPTMPQSGSYTHAENIRIISDGDAGETAVVVSVDGNELVLNLVYEYEDALQMTFLDDMNLEFGGEVEPVILRTDPKILGYTYLRNTLIIFAKVQETGMVTSVIYGVDLNDFEYEIIYESPDLNFDTDYPIQAIGIYESENIQRVYFTDNLNPTRAINIKDPSLENLPAEQLLLISPIFFTSPKITRVLGNGNLIAGVYQYAYRLKTKEGLVSRFSPLSKSVNVVDGSVYWNYEEDPENQNEYSNTTPGDATNKAVFISIENEELQDYDFLELATIYRTGRDSINSAYIVKEVRISSGEIEIIHENSTGASLLAEEITEIIDVPSKVKTIEAKDNRLFMGGLEYTAFNLEFNARAYRYARPDGEKYPIVSLQNSPGVSGEMYTYVDEDFNPLTLQGSSQYTVEHNLDAVNPYNQNTEEAIPGINHYKFKKDGITLGGEGPYVQYEFFKKKLDGNSLTGEIPSEAPFVKSNFHMAGCDDDDTLHKGDYKSPRNASEFVGYHRDEVYRFGVVLYDKFGNPGFVNWIGDIKFPNYGDYDHKDGPYGGIYNFTLAHNRPDSSGTNYNHGLGDVNAYTHMDWYDPGNAGGYESIVSSYNFADETFNTNPYNTLYALGIKFTVNIPNEIKDKISGYRIVRVERKEKDKTVLGTGVVNFMPQWWDAQQNHLYIGFNGNTSARLGYPEQFGDFGSGIGAPIGTTGSAAQVTDSHRRNITIDSPDFAFNDSYPAGNCNYIEFIGAVTGPIDTNYLGSNRGEAAIYTEHTLALDQNFLDTTKIGVEFSTKLGRGENIQVPGTDYFGETSNYNNETNIGLWNKMFASTTITANPHYVTGVGEETLFVRLDDYGFNLEPTDIPLTNAFFNTADSDNARNGKGKILASVKRILSAQYGGNTYENRKSNVYIQAGPLISIENDNQIDQYGRHEVWGGDTYVVMYDIEKIRRAGSNAGDAGPFNGDLGGAISSNFYDAKSVSYAFPVETTVNTTLRGGWHFANKTDWSINTDQRLNTFDLEPCYYSENTIESFLPKPLNFTEITNFDSRVIYSDAKIINSQVDAWRKFRLENYKDLEGLKGSINKLVVSNDIMYFLQDSAFGRLSINPVSTVIDQGGASIVLGTGSVIQDFTYISTNIGCSNPLSVVTSPAGVYWFDANTKKAYAFRANGLESISDTHGVKSWFNNYYVETANASMDAVLGYDYENSEVLFSLFPSSTMVFNEKINKFTSIYSYYTPLYMILPNKLFSVRPNFSNRGMLYQHNIGHTGQWFGGYDDVKIEFIVNKNPLYAKAFDHIEWYVGNTDNTDAFRLNLQDNFNVAKFRVASPAELVQKTLQANNQIVEDSEFSVRENISRMPVPRNSYGERLRDTYMKVSLQSINRSHSYKIILHYVKTMFRISRR